MCVYVGSHIIADSVLVDVNRRGRSSVERDFCRRVCTEGVLRNSGIGSESWFNGFEEVIPVRRLSTVLVEPVRVVGDIWLDEVSIRIRVSRIVARHTGHRNADKAEHVKPQDADGRLAGFLDIAHTDFNIAEDKVAHAEGF